MRIGYNYFLRDFNACSLQLILGTLLILFGGIYGGVGWSSAAASSVAALTGTIMLAVLPLILGFQRLLAAIRFDIFNVPKDRLYSMSTSLDQALEKDNNGLTQ